MPMRALNYIFKLHRSLVTKVAFLEVDLKTLSPEAVEVNKERKKEKREKKLLSPGFEPTTCSM